MDITSPVSEAYIVPLSEHARASSRQPSTPQSSVDEVEKESSEKKDGVGEKVPTKEEVKAEPSSQEQPENESSVLASSKLPLLPTKEDKL